MTVNKWTPTIIQEYGRFAGKKANEWMAQGKIFTCEDLALSILIEFARLKKLPFSIRNNKEKFSYSDGQISTADKMRLLRTTGAEDFSNIQFGNTRLKGSIGSHTSLGLTKVGDLISVNNQHHIQVVTTVSSGKAWIVQGNLSIRCSSLGSFIRGENRNDPQSNCYSGFKLRKFRYVLSNGNYGLDSGQQRTVFSSQNGRILEWNFMKWNNLN